LVKGQGFPELIYYGAQRAIRPRCTGTVRAQTQCKSTYLPNSKGKGVSVKLELRWSKPMIIAKFLKPNAVQLANDDTGVVVKKAHVCQLKRYHKDGGFQAHNK
jgi:hypothetical protein